MWIMNAVATTLLRLPYTGIIGAARSKTNHMTQEGSRIYCLVNHTISAVSITLQNANGVWIATLAPDTISVVSLRALNPPYGTWHVSTHALIDL